MNDASQQKPVNKRPQLLSFLCVLSFIGSGIGAFSSFMVFFLHDAILSIISSGDYDATALNLDFFSTIDRIYFLLSGLLMVISFTGVLHMWQLRRAGFHLYALSQLMILIVSTIYVYKPMDSFPMFDLLITTLFILLYLRFRNIMD